MSPRTPKTYSLDEIMSRPETAQRMLVARITAGLSLARAAAAVGCSKSLIFIYEAGNARPSEAQIARFLDAYSKASER